MSQTHEYFYRGVKDSQQHEDWLPWAILALVLVGRRR